MRKRVSRSGRSNDLPLKVTSTGCSAIRSRNANKKGSFLAVLAQEELLNFITAAFPPRDSDEKCVSPAATSKTGGFGIEKQPLFGLREISRPIWAEQSDGTAIGRIPRRSSAPAAHRKILSESVLLLPWPPEFEPTSPGHSRLASWGSATPHRQLCSSLVRGAAMLSALKRAQGQHTARSCGTCPGFRSEIDAATHAPENLECNLLSSFATIRGGPNARRAPVLA